MFSLSHPSHTPPSVSASRCAASTSIDPITSSPGPASASQHSMTSECSSHGRRGGGDERPDALSVAARGGGSGGGAYWNTARARSAPPAAAAAAAAAPGAGAAPPLAAALLAPAAPGRVLTVPAGDGGTDRAAPGGRRARSPSRPTGPTARRRPPGGTGSDTNVAPW